MARVAKENGEVKVEMIQDVKVSVDMTYEQLLGYNLDGGVRLSWDEEDFSPLPEEIERQLTRDNFKRYAVALARFTDRKRKAVKADKIVSAIDPLGMHADHRLRIRHREGWHSCWKTPGLELDAALAGPYRQVRKQKVVGKDASGSDAFENAKPGEETGDVLKLLDEQGKVELVAVECPMKLYLEHLEFVAQKSKSMFSGNNERFTESVEELNRTVDKDHRLRVIDNSGR